ncbi:hypothetical protein NHX12_031845 [Muraenolepis orangiensis]|uniref:Uncharacterized protein n=1 Tax=Muraenolepis orangiensis TaxID=630683 RepID=A0A9Q0E7S7_9TELE|nr:hypothetical protein NHX12_031845 [Muraenolepis orangiensis]
MTSDVTGMKKELATLRDRCEDLEARSRRCNIRIIGVKEGREHGKHPSQFVADMQKVSLGLDKSPTLDRALRSRPTQDGLPPQAFIYCEMPLFLRKIIDAKESNRDEISDDPRR